jgi:hypothetical protein
MKIILSRKGFDGAAGGCASPIYPDGTMLSIPIPERPNRRSGLTHYPGVHTCYEDLGTQDQLGMPQSLIAPRGGEVHLTGQVHLDPDIRPEMRPKTADKGCKNLLLFGQGDSAQTELCNAGVGEGDLFLFFGWFKDARPEGDSVRFKTRAGDTTVKEAHVIWGWLEVEKRYWIQPEGDLPNELKSAGHHPHIEYRSYYGNNNFVYVGRQHLSFNKGLRGAGVFRRYDPELRLTCPNEIDQPSRWWLPAFLQQCAVGRAIAGNWGETQDNFLHLQYIGYGQEFVFNVENHQDEARSWVERIFSHAQQST